MTSNSQVCDDYDQPIVAHWFQFVTLHDMLRQIDEPDTTHSLSSGRHALCVPIERQREFLQYLAADLDGCRRAQLPALDLCEVLAPTFRLFVTLQFCDEFTTDTTAATTATMTLQPFDVSQCVTTATAPTTMQEERHRLDNLLVAVCVAQTVTTYFPSVESNDEFFHAHCLWRPSLVFVDKEDEDARKTRAATDDTQTTRKVAPTQTRRKRLFTMRMVWPHICVTREQALTVRLGIVQALAQQFRVATREYDPNCRNVAGRNGWDSVVDRQAYFSALPMLGSTEYIDCEQCSKVAALTERRAAFSSKKRKQLLPSMHCACRGIGRVPPPPLCGSSNSSGSSNSAFQYHATVNGMAVELTMLYREKFNTNTALLLEQCCIRDSNNVYDNSNGNENNNSSNKNAVTMQLPHGAVSESNVVVVQNKSGYRLSVDSAEYLAVQNLFRNAHVVAQGRRNGHRDSRSKAQNCGSQIYATSSTTTTDFLKRYQYVSVVGLQRFVTRGGQRSYQVEIADVAGGGTVGGAANYCHNVAQRHSCATNVYFKITERNGIVQKCRCNDDCCRNGKTGANASPTVACRMYESHACALPFNIQQCLFPPTTTTMTTDVAVCVLIRKAIDKLVARCARSTDVALLKRYVAALEHAEAQSRQSYEQWFQNNANRTSTFDCGDNVNQTFDFDNNANQTTTFDFRDWYDAIKPHSFNDDELYRINELLKM